MIDVFKVGVHIAMSTNASQVLATLLSQLSGVHIAARNVEGTLGRVGQAAIGVGAAFAGWKVVDGIWNVIEHSRELNKELEKTKQLGGDFASNIEATRADAFRTMREAPTTIASDNVRLARELGSTTGKPEAVGEMLPEAAKAAHVVSHYTGEKEEEIIKNLIRTADARAQIYSVGADGKEHVDQSKLMRELGAAVRGLLLGANFITSAELRQTAVQGGAAVKQQSPEAFYADGVEASIATGASKTGTSETGLMQQFIGGTMTKKVAEHLTEAGLLHPGEWTSGKSGGVVVDPKTAQRFEPLMKNPVDWLTTGDGGVAIKSYAQKEGISTMMAIFQLFGRQTVQRLVSEITSNEPQFARAREIYGNIPDFSKQYDELQKNDLDTNIKSVAAAWKSFTEAFSDAGTPLVIPFLHGLTEAIHWLASVTADHPTIVAGVTGIVAGLAGLTALGGALLILNAAWVPLIAGLTGLTAITGLAAAGAGLTAVAAGLSSIIAPVVALMGILKIGSDHETPETHKALEDLRHARGSGLMPEPEGGNGPFGPDGAPASSYVAPTKGDGTGKQSFILNLDGKKFAEIMMDHQASSLSRAPTGGNGNDYRISPVMPGNTFPSYG